MPSLSVSTSKPCLSPYPQFLSPCLLGEIMQFLVNCHSVQSLYYWGKKTNKSPWFLLVLFQFPKIKWASKDRGFSSKELRRQSWHMQMKENTSTILAWSSRLHSSRETTAMLNVLTLHCGHGPEECVSEEIHQCSWAEALQPA